MIKVLIVDDDAKIRNIYRKLLAAEGCYEVLEAGNWEEITGVLLKDKSIDVILLDIDMPVVDGTAWFDLIRLYIPHAKVIVASVYGLEDQKRLIDAADGYFDKAQGTEALLLKIRNILHIEGSSKR